MTLFSVCRSDLDFNDSNFTRNEIVELIDPLINFGFQRGGVFALLFDFDDFVGCF